MLKRKHIIYGVLGLILTNPAYAALVCSSQPVCSALGYDTTDVECPDGVLMSCPLDKTYKKCIKPDVTHTEEDCAMLGFTATDKSDWCPENKVLCPYDDSYSLCASGLTCSTLGFSRTDKTAWCQDIVKCPYDATMTLCASKITCLENQVLVDGKCYNAYTSCEAAGYDTDDNSDMYCSSSDTIYLSDGTLTSCYDGCSDIYSSCSAAGFVDPIYYDYCTGSNVDIYTSNSGDTYTCNTSCGDCLYTTAPDCESKYTNSVCTVDSKGCYNPTSCKTNYVTSCTSPYYITGKDENGCGTCKTDCAHVTEATCESAYKNSECTKNSSGCYVPTSCKTNYATSCSLPYYITGKDGNGCGSCITDCLYLTKASCESKYTNSVCAANSNNCYAPTGCKTNYVTSCSLPYYITGKDGNGCGSCITDCLYLTKSSCESKFNHSTCSANSSNCYEPTSCKSGYVTSCTSPYYLANKDGNGCGTCETDCSWTTKSSCESANSNVVCGVENGCYVPTACKSGFVFVTN